MEQRWHEIATEGLPPAGGDYFVWDGTSVEQREWFVGTDRSMWLDPFDDKDNQVVQFPERITWWQPVVKPEPPSKEPE